MKSILHRSRALARCAVLAGAAALSACAPPAPPEFAVYTTSFEQSRQAARAIAGVFAPIERAQRAPAPDRFDPDEAAYLVEGAPVGLSGEIVRGFDAVADYNEVLAAYASGAAVAALRPRAAALAATAGRLGAALGAPQAGVAARGLASIGGALLAVSDRRAFAEVVSRRAGLVDEFLAEMRAATPAMYQAARAYRNDLELTLLTAGRDAEIPALDEALETFRRALAVWVLTIDQTRGASAALEAAVASDDPGANLRTAAALAAEAERFAGRAVLIANDAARRF